MKMITGVSLIPADFHQALRLSLDSFDAVDDQDHAVYCC